MKRIAIVGSGISGVASAFYLRKLGFDVEIFEAGQYFGGHTNTIDIQVEGKTFPIDTGFLVHNDRTYPNLIDFFEELKIETHPSDMSFSVVQKQDKLTWCGTNLFTVFAQKRNLVSPRFYRFLSEVLRFNRNATTYLKACAGDFDLTLGDLLDRHHYSQDFRHWYLLPMGGCIWSTPTQGMLKFPAYTFLIFCMNHGLLQVFDHPQWKTIIGGCRVYVERALADIEKKNLASPVSKIASLADTVEVHSNNIAKNFDYVFVCSHPPEALKMLAGQGGEILDVLGNFKYQPNLAVVHTDSAILPERKRAWAAWNYLSAKQQDGQEAVSVSYLINKLQPVPTKTPVIVTLNPLIEVAKEKILREIKYEHPLFDSNAIRAQSRVAQLQGRGRIYYAGAWLRYGFHEDGIWAAKQAIRSLLRDLGDDVEKVRLL